MNILGIETSTRRASLAIVSGGALLREDVLPEGGNPSARLVPALERLLRECALSPAAVDGIAVGTGPGSFTGIRIGLATARGFSIARGTPIRGICGFDNLIAGIASPVRGPGGGGKEPGRPLPRVCAIVDAHSYGLYAAVYEREAGGYRRAGGPFVCKPDDLPGRAAGEVFFTGPHLGKFREALAGLFGARAKFDAEDRFPTAASAALLYDDPAALRDDPPGTVSPLYLLPGVRVKAAARGL